MGTHSLVRFYFEVVSASWQLPWHGVVLKTRFVALEKEILTAFFFCMQMCVLAASVCASLSGLEQQVNGPLFPVEQRNQVPLMGPIYLS